MIKPRDGVHCDACRPGYTYEGPGSPAEVLAHRPRNRMLVHSAPWCAKRKALTIGSSCYPTTTCLRRGITYRWECPYCPPPILMRGPGVRAPGEVGRHSEICELRSGDPAMVPASCDDIAIAAVVDAAAVSSWQGSVVDGYDTPTVYAPLQSNVRVKKSWSDYRPDFRDNGGAHRCTVCSALSVQVLQCSRVVSGCLDGAVGWLEPIRVAR